jgi:hypothetical protein
MKDKCVTATLDQISELLPILKAKPGDVFAHATDKGNYLNPDTWYDVVVFKGIHDPETSDPTLLGDNNAAGTSLPKGWLIFHWHPDNPGRTRTFYQAGAWQRGAALVAAIPDMDMGTCGGRPLGIALPLEDCWGMRTLEEFGCNYEELQKYDPKADRPRDPNDMMAERTEQLKEAAMEQWCKDMNFKKKAKRMVPECANSAS